MAKKKTESEKPRGRPATSPKDREDEMINLAIGLAEQQLRDGTASTAVIVHYLKLGSTRGMLENDMLEEKRKLLKAQTDSVESSKRVEELYKKALSAMQIYGGKANDDESEV